MSQILCPKCGSDQVTADKKGFSGKKAVAGALLTGGIGILAGTIGSNKIKITCLSCGYVFKPGQGAKSHFDYEEKKKIDLKSGIIAAVVLGLLVLIGMCNSGDTKSTTQLVKQPEQNSSSYSEPVPNTIKQSVIIPDSEIVRLKTTSFYKNLHAASVAMISAVTDDSYLYNAQNYLSSAQNKFNGVKKFLLKKSNVNEIQELMDRYDEFLSKGMDPSMGTNPNSEVAAVTFCSIQKAWVEKYGDCKLKKPKDLGL